MGEEGRRRRKGSEEERKGGNWLPQAKNYEFRVGKIILNMLKIKGKTKNRALNCRFFRLRRTTYLTEGKKTSNNLIKEGKTAPKAPKIFGVFQERSTRSSGILEIEGGE